MKDINTKELFEMAQSGDKEARDRLIVDNIRLVHSLAKKYLGMDCYESIVQEGTIGLIKSVDNFEVDKGFKFSTYAVAMIDGYIRAFIRDYREDRPFRPKRSDYELYREVLRARTTLTKEMQYDPTISEIAKYIKKDEREVEYIVNAIENSTSMYSKKYRSEGSRDDILIIDSISEQNIPQDQVINKIIIEKALENLTKKQREVISLRYFKEYSQTKTGQALNISQAQISRIEKQALKMLKEVI